MYFHISSIYVLYSSANKVQLLLVTIILLSHVVFRESENLLKLCNCNPPRLYGYSNISLLYFGGFPLPRKSVVVFSYCSTYIWEGLGRDNRMWVIMLDTRLFNTEIFPCDTYCVLLKYK